MRKRVYLFAILLSFSLLISVNLADAQGTCLRKTTNFCQLRTIEECCGTNQECREKLFYPGVSPENTTLCNYPVSCCIDTCTAAQVYGIYSPLACLNQAAFVQKSCDEFSECRIGCAFCSGDTRAIGLYKLKDASAECIRLGKTLSYFNDTINTATLCNELTQPITETFNVSGKVVNAITTTGISGANVLIAGKSQITDANGNFEIRNVAKGNHTITAIADFYEVNYTKINLIQNIINYQINLTKLNNASLEVTVLDSTGQIIPDAIVEISKTGFYQKLATASDGKTTFRYIPFGDYSIIATKAGLQGTGSITLSEAQLYQTSITLGAAPVIPSSNLTGVIRDSTGAVVDSATITLAGPTTASTLSSNGAYEFRNIPSGTYTATITPPPELPLLPLTDVITLPAGTNTQDFTLQPVSAEFINTTLQVLDQSTQNPIPNARIRIRQITAATAVEIITNESGEYTIQLQRTSYEITIIKEGFNVLTDIIDLSNVTAPTTFTFLLSAAAKVSVFGIVKDADGRLMAAAQVYIEGLVATIAPTFAITDGNGYYRIENIPTGNYTLTASKTGYIDQSVLINLDMDKEQNFILTTRECNVQIIKPEIKRIELKKDNVEIEFLSSCEATGAYIYRCEMIGSECSMKPITNILAPEITKYADYNIKPDATYFYEVRTVHEKPYVQMVASDKKSISTGHQSCFLESGEFCLNNTRYKCDANNTLQEIIPTDVNRRKSDDTICRYRIDNPKITEYVRKLNCTIECNKPLGMFASFGSLTIPLPTPPQTVTQQCDAIENDVKDRIPEVDVLSCYKDYTQTAVDKFFSCDEVSSCYDYKSERACKANRCLHKTPCEWKPYPTTKALGLGICRPTNTTLQDCNFCNLDKYNNFFGACSSEICDLYAEKTEHSGCYFEQSSKKCLNKREMSCEYYGKNETQCIGQNPARNVSVDIYGTNRIIINSNDSLGLGLCKFNTTFAPDRCFKDANNDTKPDLNPTDMKPPFTVIEHETAAKGIDFSAFVYDDEDFNSTITPIATKFLVGTTFVGPSPGISYLEAQNGRIVDYSVPNGIWNVYFFSEDNSNNLEIIKTFKILIDTIKPSITASAQQIGKTGTVVITLNAIDYPDTTKLVRCKTSLEDGSGRIIQPNIRTIKEDEGFNGEKEETFSELTDGIYLYKYNCKDWVNNEISGSISVLVDTDQFITIIAPNGTVSSADSIEISTILEARCLYDVTDNLQATTATAFADFQQTGGTTHRTSIDLAENKAYKLFVKCKITVPGGEQRETNVKQSYFTIDKQKPYTNITVPESDLVPFNLTRWRKSAQFKLKCNDPDIPSDNADFAPDEFGCSVLRYCLEDVQCKPINATITYNATVFDPKLNKTINITKTDLLTEKVLQVNTTKWLCYESVDKGGNVESPRCELIRVDTTPPIVKITGTNPRLTADGRTNSATINVTGEITNIAFSAKSYSGMIPYAFVDYSFDALILPDVEIAEIRFNYLNAQTYDYLIFNFGDNIIIGKVGTQSISQSASIKGQQVPLKITRTGGTTTIDTTGLSQSYVSTDEPTRILLQTGSWKNITVVDDSITSPLAKLRIKLDNATIINEDNPSTTFNRQILIASLLTKPEFKGRIEVSADDEAGNTGKETINITYDVIGPVSAPVIDPPITNIFNMFGENYQKLSYPLYYDGKDYYTNTNQLWITGYTFEPLEKIELVRTTPEGTKQVVEYIEKPISFYSTPPATISALRLKFTTEKGSNSIVASGDLTAILNYFRDNFGGNVYIGFLTHHRISYGNYSDYYNATSWSFSEGDTIINIAPALEESVPENEPFLLINDSRDEDRFKRMIDLIDNNINNIYGNNTFWINQYDDLGNSGRSFDKITIYVDKSTPLLNSVKPSVFLAQNNITIKSLNNMTFEISESGFGIRPESIQLNVNGANKTFQKQILSTGLSHTLTMYYAESLKDGPYNITLIVKDKAGNELKREWSVAVDSALPSYPEIRITNNVNISSAPDGYVFVEDGSKPDFSIFYPDYLANVTIASVSLINKTAGEAIVAGYEINCTRTAGINSYNCLLNQNLPSGNNDYALKIRSQKVYTDGTFGPAATHYYFFAVDRTAPALSNLRIMPTGTTESYINSRALLEYTINVEKENHPLYAETRINDILVGNISLAATGTLSVASNLSEIGNLLLIDGNSYPVQARICDYAGNCNSLAGSITIDDTAPKFTTNLTIEARPLFIVESQIGNATYVVREDLIMIAGTLEQTDTVAMSLYRGNPRTTNPIMTISECIGGESINCISGNSFNFKGTSIVMGEVGKVEQNNIYIVAVDRAGNLNDPPLIRVILKDVQRPAIQICVEGGLRCTVVEREEVPVITDTATMKQKCGANSDCYDALIKKACEDLLSKDQTDSLNSCYKGYVVKLSNPDLWTLCEKTGLLRDDCINELAIATKVASLCQNIIYAALQTNCITAVTS